jgi:predicted MFS family arabinose efflux permease
VGFTSYLGIWLNELLRSDSGRISLAYAAINLCAFAAGTSGGFVADRYGKRRITLAATIVMTAGFAGIAAVSSSIASLVFTAAVIFGASLRNAPLNAIVTSLVPAGKTPGYVAARNIASQTGIGFAILVSGILYSSEGIEFVAVFCGLLTAISFAILRLIPELEGRRFDTAEIKIGAAPAYGNGS